MRRDQPLAGMALEGVRHYSDHPHEALLFYGGPFSNFVGGPFKIKSDQPWCSTLYEAVYPTVEHFFAASKAEEESAHEAIRTANGPSYAKSLGRRVHLRADWEEEKYAIMLIGLRAKFQVKAWRDSLLATGDRYIAEDSPTDFIWGIRSEGGGWDGQNMLGEALMQVRREIQGGVS